MTEVNANPTMFGEVHEIIGSLIRNQDATLRISSISNGNRIEWSPVRSVVIRVITKSDDRAAGVRFAYREYDYRPNWTTRSLITI